MTEREWLEGEDVRGLLTYLTRNATFRSSVHPLVTPRRLRLFAVACLRPFVRHSSDPRSLAFLETAERLADGLPLTASESENAIQQKWIAGKFGIALELAIRWSAKPDRFSVASCWEILSIAQRVNRERMAGLTFSERHFADLLRDAFGNPFLPRRPLEAEILTPDVLAVARSAYEVRSSVCASCKGRGRWKDRYVITSSHGERLLEEPNQCLACDGSGRSFDGVLDPAALSILSDALEEAGCSDPAVLSHLRGCGPHVRGCWAVDVCLGRW